MSETAHILIVDDDERVCRSVSHYLEREGFRIGVANDGVAMWEYLAIEQPELVLLDIMLPGADGFTLARKLRAKSDIGIMMLTGKKDSVDTVVGLELGADDYITKPFDNRVLLARIHSFLRRLPGKNGNVEIGLSSQNQQIVWFEGWQLNLSTYEFTSPAGKDVHLTTHEFRLLKIFIESAGHVLSRDQILNKLSSRDWSPDDRSVDVLIGRLRKVMQEEPSNPKMIHTVRNAGYQFTPRVTFRPQ